MAFSLYAPFNTKLHGAICIHNGSVSPSVTSVVMKAFAVGKNSFPLLQPVKYDTTITTADSYIHADIVTANTEKFIGVVLRDANIVYGNRTRPDDLCIAIHTEGVFWAVASEVITTGDDLTFDFTDPNFIKVIKATTGKAILGKAIENSDSNSFVKVELRINGISGTIK